MKKTVLYLNLLCLFFLTVFLSCNKKRTAFFSNPYSTGYVSSNTKDVNPNASSKEQTPMPDGPMEIVAAVGEQIILKPKSSRPVNASGAIKAVLSEEAPQIAELETAVTSKKELRRIVKDTMKKGMTDDSNVAKLLLVIIAILLPPLAVALVDGIHGPFWLSILLTILLYLPGLIYAIYRIYKND